VRDVLGQSRRLAVHAGGGAGPVVCTTIVCGCACGDINDQTKAPIQPSTVHPKRMFTAAIGPVWGCLRKSAMKVGPMYIAKKTASIVIPSMAPAVASAATELVASMRLPPRA